MQKELNYVLMELSESINERDYKILKAEYKTQYTVLVEIFKNKLTALKYKSSDDTLEHVFINLIKDCYIGEDAYEHKHRIGLYNRINGFMLEYDLKSDTLKCSYYNVLMFFEKKCALPYTDWPEFILDQIEQHFNFRPAKFIVHH